MPVKNPHKWTPPLESADCAYAVAWVIVKEMYELGANSAEVDALKELSGVCEMCFVRWVCWMIL